MIAFAFAIPLPLAAAAAASSDFEQGKRLFQGMCVTCHGFEGAGGDAPPLNRPKLERAPDDAALRAVIGEGIPERGMPRVRRMTDNELRQLVSYVRSLGQTNTFPISGSPQNGAEIYQRLGCATCHIVKGQGGSLGPDLTNIGRMRGVEYLRLAVVDPAATLPRGTLPVPARGYSEYLPVLAVTRDGKQVQGMRINEDVFTIQLRDMTNQIHSFRKADLTRLEKQRNTSLMPPLAAQLAPAELNDLVAYLSSLRGAP
jgi:cytochrome c oxidase cbb3-type subunit 3